MFVMGFLLELMKRFPLLLLAVVLFITHIFVPELPLFVPLLILGIWFAWAFIAEMKIRARVLTIDANPSSNELLDKMFADNGKGYRNSVDAVNEIVRQKTSMKQEP